jgi:hypothetical protein
LLRFDSHFGRKPAVCFASCGIGCILSKLSDLFLIPWLAAVAAVVVSIASQLADCLGANYGNCHCIQSSRLTLVAIIGLPKHPNYRH